MEYLLVGKLSLDFEGRTFCARAILRIFCWRELVDLRGGCLCSLNHHTSTITLEEEAIASNLAK